MQKRKIILWLLVEAEPTDGESGHPRMRPFDDPPVRFESGNLLYRLRLLPTRAHVGGKAEFLITQEALQPFLDRPQIDRLPDKGGAMQASQSGEKVLIMLLEVGKEGLILAQAQVGAHHFHRQELAIGKVWQGPSLAQPLAACERRQHLVNPVKTCDNELVQVHERPPRAALC